MRCTFRSSIAAALAAALALGTLTLAPAEAAAAGPQIKAPTTLDLSARRRHHRYYGNNAAALRMFGMMMGTIAPSPPATGTAMAIMTITAGPITIGPITAAIVMAPFIATVAAILGTTAGTANLRTAAITDAPPEHRRWRSGRGRVEIGFGPRR